jgi:maleylpyruvate isomerase
VRLYGYWRSTSTWRVRIALAHKNIEHEYVPVLLRQNAHRGAQFRAKNPMAQVPVLEIQNGGETTYLGQSMAILEYLEERFAEPPLLPRDRMLRARSRQLAELVNAGIQPLQNLAVLNRVERLAGATERAAWTREFIAAGLDALEALARDGAGRYLVGDVVTFGDVFLVPQLYNARRFGVEVAPYATLLRVERECEALEAFQRAHPDAQPDAER